MTKIRYSMRELSLDAEGHAGAAPEGQDIVCAGISALTQAMLHALNDEEEKGRLEVFWLMEKGRIQIRVKSAKSWKYWLMAKSYLTMAVRGLKDIAERYPEHIEVKEEQEDGII